jgi:hypothetical protein
VCDPQLCCRPHLVFKHGRRTIESSSGKFDPNKKMRVNNIINTASPEMVLNSPGRFATCVIVCRACILSRYSDMCRVQRVFTNIVTDNSKFLTMASLRWHPRLMSCQHQGSNAGVVKQFSPSLFFLFDRCRRSPFRSSLRSSMAGAADIARRVVGRNVHVVKPPLAVTALVDFTRVSPGRTLVAP